MSKVQDPPKRLVLVGAGHAHVAVLRAFAMKPPANTRITVISPESYATYSGMVPGYLAGQYELRDAQIDARALAARANATFLAARVTAIDPAENRLTLDRYLDQHYDVVSFDIGSRPAHAERIGDHPNTVLVKPIEVAAREVGNALAGAPAGSQRSVVIVGAGPGGVEVAFAVANRLRDEENSTVTVCDRAAVPVRERGERASAAVARAFAHHDILFRGNVEVEAVDAGGVRLADGTVLPADLVVWATGASAPPLLADSGLTVDDRGFLLVDDSLRCIDHPNLFAAGDCATMESYPNIGKAGVYAVRQGPVLTANLRNALEGRRLGRYKPQRGFLSLLNTGDGKAILSYRNLAVRSRVAWWLKDFIDRRFMRRYERPRLGPPDTSMGEMAPCGGCAAKVGADVLERVLGRLDVPTAPHISLGLADADDAAAFRLPSPPFEESYESVVTTDLFPPFENDLELVGRVAAISAASDLFAMGAEGAAALAIVAVAEDDPVAQETILEALLHGAVGALAELDIPLVGGHTIVADSTLIGFSMHGYAESARLLRKSGARVGDALVLSKPLGTGVVLAAGRAGVADSDWVDACHAAMLRSNAPMMRLLLRYGAHACTDVTGFGLSGHLADLARKSGITAELDPGAIPALPGALELLGHGWRSSFHSMNERVRATPGDGLAPLLLDPQTSGGLLATLPQDNLASFKTACDEAGEPVWMIGRVVEDRGMPLVIGGRV